MAQLIVNNKGKFSLGLIEDAAMGKLVKSLNLVFTPLPSLVVDSIESLSRFSDLELKKHFHFRVKSGSMTSRNDVQIMTRLHERLVNLEVV